MGSDHDDDLVFAAMFELELMRRLIELETSLTERLEAAESFSPSERLPEARRAFYGPIRAFQETDDDDELATLRSLPLRAWWTVYDGE